MDAFQENHKRTSAYLERKTYQAGWNACDHAGRYLTQKEALQVEMSVVSKVSFPQATSPSRTAEKILGGTREGAEVEAKKKARAKNKEKRALTTCGGPTM
jgi:hypothetical protein